MKHGPTETFLANFSWQTNLFWECILAKKKVVPENYIDEFGVFIGNIRETYYEKPSILGGLCSDTKP